MSKDSSKDYFDVIVIGAGGAGLTTSALLTKAGKKVLLVEKEARIGGHISPLVSGPYQFDTGARLLMGCNADGPFGPGITYSLLEQLGVADRCEFIPIQPFISIHLPGLKFPMQSGRQAFTDGMRQLFPSGLENLPQLLDLCGRVYQSGKAFTLARKPWELLKISAGLAELFRYRNATLDDVLTSYIPDPRPRVALRAIWPYLSMAPKRASFLMWAVLMSTYMEEGAYYCKGGLHSLTDAIAESFVRQGGELLLNSEPIKIFVENRAVTGVRLANGREAFAPTVVSTIDPRSVFGELIDAHQVPAWYHRKLKSFELSNTLINISLVTDIDLCAAGFEFETFIYDSWDEGQIQRNPINGQVGAYTLTVTTMADSSLALPGQHLVSAATILSDKKVQLSPDANRRYGEIFFAELMKHIPQLEDHLILGSSDGHPDGYITHTFGPLYGWALSPQQSGLGRLGQNPPVKGLYLAGQWTRPGPGVMSVILSGMAVAQTILNRDVDSIR
jgi:all-trans-retinol 13,14-reductase